MGHSEVERKVLIKLERALFGFFWITKKVLNCKIGLKVVLSWFGDIILTLSVGFWLEPNKSK